MSESCQCVGVQIVCEGAGGLSMVENTIHNEEREIVGSMTC